MASTADLVLKNICWTIESITPTHSRPDKNFRWFDRTSFDPESSAGIVRLFSVLWQNQSEELGITDTEDREANHTYVISVAYPPDGYRLSLLQEIILQDRHDIIKALRDPNSWDGYNSKNTTTDIGLYNREFKSAEMIEVNDSVWELRLTVICTIKEGE